MTDLELHHFLEPVKTSWALYSGIRSGEMLGDQVDFNNGNPRWFENLHCDVMLVGVPEARNSPDNPTTAAAPELLRHWLYGMRKTTSGLRIGDAGDVRGKTLNDRYAALQQVVKILIHKEIKVVLVGGSQDLSVPVVKALKECSHAGAIAIVDAGIDLDVTHTDFSSRAFLNHLVGADHSIVDELSIMGCQYYFCSPAQEKFLKERYFSMLRLRELRSPNIDYAEVVLRDSSFLSFDFGALENQPHSLPGALSPNGLSAADACRIMWYAGAADLMKVAGLFEVPVVSDHTSANGPLSAQLIWHFLEGMGARCGDYPFKPLEVYKYLVVPVAELDETLHFYHNQMNNRWWLEVPFYEKTKVVPCHEDDYKTALKNELPQKWWRYFLRSKKEPVKNGPS